MTRGERIFVSAAAGYIVAGLLSFGWLENHLPYDCITYRDGTKTCSRARDFEAAFLGGFLWPVYWSAKAAIEVTKWPPIDTTPE